MWLEAMYCLHQFFKTDAESGEVFDEVKNK